MLFRMIRGALFRQKGKMALIAFTIALGASLATGMLNVMLDVGDKVNQELKTYGANIVVKPKASSLLSDIYHVSDNNAEALSTAYLAEDEIWKIKSIFWTYNIVDFAPFLQSGVTLPSGESAAAVGTWFNHHLDLHTGESLDAGVTSLRSWWDLTDGRWIDESQEDALHQVMAGTTLAAANGWKAGDRIILQGSRESAEVTVVGIYDAGGDEDEQLYVTLDLAQLLSGRENRVASVEVSAITTPDNELSRRAAINPAALSSTDYETWYCTAYVSAICYQIQSAITGSTASAVRQVAEGEGAILDKTQLLMILITALSLVGAALGIANLVTAGVMERSKEFGLLKAIGARDGQITGVVVTEILVTALVGGVAGYFMGFGFAQLIGQTVFDSAIEMKPLVIPIVAGLIVLMTMAGCIPAIRMVLRLRPAEVLHGGH
ncbi:MAG: ABC transporter permease [Clostridia bacterium]|nr:ABC transporter permease [Clostridia bacterium]